MTIEEWLSGLEYDSAGMFITKHINGGPVKVLDIRGWSTLVKSFDSEDIAALFQDAVGEFILRAINEKLENDKSKLEVWNKVVVGLDSTRFKLMNRIKFLLLVQTTLLSKFQIDNLDWCILKKENNTVVVENEHGTTFDLDELNDNELELALQSIRQ